MSRFVHRHIDVADPLDDRNRAWIFGVGASNSVGPFIFDRIFPQIGLPSYSYGAQECKSLLDEGNAWATEMAQPHARGSCLTMPLKLEAMTLLDALEPEAVACGSVNTTFWQVKDKGSTTRLHVGTNLDAASIYNCLLAAFTRVDSPFPPELPTRFMPSMASAVVFGGGGAARAAVYSLDLLGLSPIYVVNRDEAEIEAIVAHFHELDVRHLRTDAQAAEALASDLKRGVRLVAAVGAIPATEPRTDAERQVYRIAEALFQHGCQRGESENRMLRVGEFLGLPDRPVLLELAYKPLMTRLRGKAELHNWETLCGIEAVLECCFEQTYLWTGIGVPPDVRDEVRRAVREEMSINEP